MTFLFFCFFAHFPAVNVACQNISGICTGDNDQIKAAYAKHVLYFMLYRFPVNSTIGNCFLNQRGRNFALIHAPGCVFG